MTTTKISVASKQAAVMSLGMAMNTGLTPSTKLGSLTILLVTLLHAGGFAHAESVSTELHIRATTAASFTYKVHHMPDSLNLTPSDLKKGYAVLNNAALLSFSNTGSAGTRLALHAMDADFFLSVEVTVQDNGMFELLPGEIIEISVPTSPSSENTIKLDCIYRISPGTKAGKHPWPLQIQLSPQ